MGERKALLRGQEFERARGRIEAAAGLQPGPVERPETRLPAVAVRDAKLESAIGKVPRIGQELIAHVPRPEAGGQAEAAVLAALEQGRTGWRFQLKPAVERLPARRALPVAVDRCHYPVAGGVS